MLAIPVFRSRVAPVLNWCSKIYVFPQDVTDVGCCEEIVLFNMSAFNRLRMLHDEGVQTLICGALSQDLLSYGEMIGLNIIDGVAGEVHEVLQAYQAEKLDNPRFWLPGSHGPRSCHNGWKWANSDDVDREEHVDESDVTQLADRKGAGRVRRMSSRLKSSRFCVCPRCGVAVSQEQGVPCAQIVCPRCNRSLVRK